MSRTETDLAVVKRRLIVAGYALSFSIVAAVVAHWYWGDWVITCMVQALSWSLADVQIMSSDLWLESARRGGEQ